ncbi:ABC transporter permease [Nibrella saemangeumensis]|uniref:ABC transporter permease n=1 Tax=Nibrella saemangeumensis TaxID=1084526 RepID=A0ABP8MSZ7_9BACT
MKPTDSKLRPVEPPRWTHWLLTTLHPSETLEEVEGDLVELYTYWYHRAGRIQATLRYVLNVVSVLPPFVRRRQPKQKDYLKPEYGTISSLHPDMIRNYLKIAFRNLLKHKGYSFINILGLAIGMAVATLIGLWLYDELSFDKYHPNYDRIAQVMQHNLYNGEKKTQVANPAAMGPEIREKYGSDFDYVIQSSWTGGHVLAVGEKRFTKIGNFFDPEVADMLSLNMLKGTRAGLKDPYSIFLSESVAKAFFGDGNPLGKIMRVDNQFDVKVTGVYEDLPYNTSFREIAIMMPWSLYLIQNTWIKEMDDPWDSNFSQTFAQIAENADMDKVSAKIKDVKFNRISKEDRRYKPEVFLHPMSKWHLYSDFKNGINIGGRIEFVWLFGLIGIFVLLLACINFMNLATARSEKRAKEVGIRKAVGSVRSQLINQFFLESILVVFLAFIVSLVLVLLVLPYFNEVADKKTALPWANPVFWGLCIAFCLLTGLIAGSYPALYLSSFQPVKVLKGVSFRVGRFAAVPRKVLVVLQFTVSITLIIGTIVVFKQIEHAKNRPLGYNRAGLIRIGLEKEVSDHYEAVRNELKSIGAIEEMTQARSPLTSTWNTNGGFDWEGKDPNLAVDFPNNAVSYEYGKVVGWTIKEGRDFSKAFATDSVAFIINESAAKFLGFKEPVGTILRWNDKPFQIIGVVKDLLAESPYEPVRPSLFHIARRSESLLIVRLNRNLAATSALAKVEGVLKKFTPNVPFEYNFVDEEYARKFGNEERIGKLATWFAVLAIFISCLGLFGLASFIAEQRTKEIGIRKVLGASVTNLWGLLSKDFVQLVIIACLLASPIAWYFLNNWIQKYEYRTDIPWWVFIASGAGALLITLLTVSYQALKAALINPVKSLRSE